jgi:hypothetical protein
MRQWVYLGFFSALLLVMLIDGNHVGDVLKNQNFHTSIYLRLYSELT